MTAFNFNPADHNANFSGAQPVVPIGRYLVAGTSAEMKAARNNPNAYMIEYKLQIQEGEHKGVTIIDNINVQNPNNDAMRIGFERLAAYCQVLGITHVQDTNQLLGIPMYIDVNVTEVQASDPTKPPRKFNNITNAEPAQGAGQTPPPSAPPAAPAPAAPQPNGAAPAAPPAAAPWQQQAPAAAPAASGPPTGAPAAAGPPTGSAPAPGSQPPPWQR